MDMDGPTESVLFCMIVSKANSCGILVRPEEGSASSTLYMSHATSPSDSILKSCSRQANGLRRKEETG